MSGECGPLHATYRDVVYCDAHHQPMYACSLQRRDDALLRIYARIIAATNATGNDLANALHDIQVIVEQTVPADDLALAKVQAEDAARIAAYDASIPTDVTYDPKTGEVSLASDQSAALTQAANVAEYGWVVVANAYGSDWTQASTDWQEAAGCFRDQYHALLDTLRVTRLRAKGE